MKRLSIFLMILIMNGSNLAVAAQRQIDWKSSQRVAIIPEEEVQSVAFNFCSGKKSFSLINGLWLSYLSALEYSHYKVIGPQLEALGFGDKGEGTAFLKSWYVVRLKRILEKSKTIDDTWRSETERFERLSDLRAEYRGAFGEVYKDDGQSADAFEAEVLGVSGERKIQFLNGHPKSAYFSPTTQAFYAEHTALDFAVIAYRGTESDSIADLRTDLNLVQSRFEDLGRIHSGFLASHRELEDQIITLLRKRSQKETRPLNLWITGHSMGGAVAALMTAKIILLQENGELPNVRLMGTYTIGAPRIGNPVFARAFDELTQKAAVTVVRIRNAADAISRLPIGLPGENGYWHVGALAYFGRDGTLSQGDGWEGIESDSDYLTYRLPSLTDHRLISYWLNMKEAYLKANGTEASDCTLVDPNSPPLPFYENPADRK